MYLAVHLKVLVHAKLLQLNTSYRSLLLKTSYYFLVALLFFVFVGMMRLFKGFGTSEEKEREDLKEVRVVHNMLSFTKSKTWEDVYRELRQDEDRDESLRISILDIFVLFGMFSDIYFSLRLETCDEYVARCLVVCEEDIPQEELRADFAHIEQRGGSNIAKGYFLGREIMVRKLPFEGEKIPAGPFFRHLRRFGPSLGFHS